MLGSQLLDVMFVPLYVSGIETIKTVGGGGYGDAIIHANYTHSLVGALVISALAGLLAARIWGRRGGLVIGAVVFSHWVLDLIVHRPDMPILPGNLGDLPLLGLGLWQWPVASAGLETALVAVGALLYFRSVVLRSKETVGQRYTIRAFTAGGVTSALLVLCLITDVMS
jgi:hypothetical protein